MGGFCLLVELHRKGSAPAACAAGLFINKIGTSWDRTATGTVLACPHFVPGCLCFDHNCPRFVATCPCFVNRCPCFVPICPSFVPVCPSFVLVCHCFDCQALRQNPLVYKILILLLMSYRPFLFSVFPAHKTPKSLV